MNILEIDLKKLTNNYKFLRSLLSSETKMIGVVKANGYGSEINKVAIKLEELGIDALAVAYSFEGKSLRKSGINLPIIVFYPQVENFKEIVKYNLEPALYSKRSLMEFKKVIMENNFLNYAVHIKYNTGLNRIGFHPDEIDWVINEIQNSTFFVKTIYSHLGATEEDRPNLEMDSQIKIFESIIQKHKISSKEKVEFHLLNTSGIFNYPEFHLDWVRTGIGLYGFANKPLWNSKLQPIASLKTSITQIHKIKEGEIVGYNCGWKATKDTKIAVIPIGHADGISRNYGNGTGWVIIKGKKVHMVGNICMDMTMIEIDQIDCKEGDTVIVFGNEPRADNLAEMAGTISYELLSGLSPRILRKTIY